MGERHTRRQVVRRGIATRALYNPRLDAMPRAIAFCENTAGVAQVIRFACAPAAASGASCAATA